MAAVPDARARPVNDDPFDGIEDAPIIEGPPETWDDFCDRMQRHCGKGSRCFVMRQPNSSAGPFVMILVPGPFREDFLP